MVTRLFIAIALASDVYGQITLSEVLSNEPAGRVRLEWIELYNRSPVDFDLAGISVVAGGDTTDFPSGSMVGGEAFAVIARQPVPENGSDSFEGYWGDSSGVWGDSEIESFALFAGNFQLGNSSGSVALIDSTGMIIDQYNWNSASDDGRSVEKDDLTLDFTSWHDCFDPAGSTPGRSNSEVPPSGADVFTVDVFPRMLSRGPGAFDYFRISAVIPPGSIISVEAFDDSGSRIKTLLNEERSPLVELYWGASDDSGRRLNPGIYILAIYLEGRRNEQKFIPVVIGP